MLGQALKVLKHLRRQGTPVRAHKLMSTQTAGHKPRGRKQKSFIYDAFHHVLNRIYQFIGINLSPAFGGAMVPQWCRNLPPLVYTPWLGHV